MLGNTNYNEPLAFRIEKKEEFRNNIYPIILKNIMDEKGVYPEDEWIEGKVNLEKLYHLTD